MLSTPTPDQLRALHALKAHHGWAGFEAILQGELRAIQDRMVMETDLSALHRAQGMARGIILLQVLVADAAKLLAQSGHTGL